MGLSFQTPARAVDPGYCATIDRLCYALHDEGRDKDGAQLDALFVYPPGRPDLALRVCSGHVAMANLDRIHDGFTTIERVLEIHGTPVPQWISER